MLKDVVIEPMTGEFILWRCLHGGPLARDTIDQWPADSHLPWESYRKRNLPLLLKLIRAYGTCAIVARDGSRIVGHLRFYPKAVWKVEKGCGFCLQQDAPSGPAEDYSETDFPVLERIADKTLTVHCLMTGCPQQKENLYQRQGVGSRLVKFLIQWAKTKGWDRLEALSFEDLLLIYENTGSAGRVFWEKLGFSMAERYPHPDLQEPSEFVKTLEDQARAVGIPPERARDQLVMRLALTGPLPLKQN